MLSLSVPLVLASQSPRRRHLLESLGLSFTASPTHVDESIPDTMPPGDAAEELARRKAAARNHPGALVLTADTIVVLDRIILGKPANEAEARSILRRLSGCTHEVFTGIALSYEGRIVAAHEITRVTFSTLTDSEIKRYVASGSPMDKAGAYGIQDDAGALFISGIEGDFYNVVGLPLHRLYRLLKESFPGVLADRNPGTNSTSLEV